MHFEILVEGQGELTTLSTIMLKIIGDYSEPHTWKIHKHRGIGSIPDDPRQMPDRRNNSLLHNLPSRLRAYGKSLTENDIVVVLVDLDDRADCRAFKNDLLELLQYTDPAPRVLFRIAIEELEAWFLGDRSAIREAYPTADFNRLRDYIQDSQCGTWEKLADVVYQGGYNSLSKLGSGKRSRLILEEKKKWAVNISRHLDVENNNSESFCAFRDGLRSFISEN